MWHGHRQHGFIDGANKDESPRSVSSAPPSHAKHGRNVLALLSGVGSGLAFSNRDQVADWVSRTLGMTSSAIAPLIAHIRNATTTKELDRARKALGEALTPEQRARLQSGPLEIRSTSETGTQIEPLTDRTDKEQVGEAIVQSKTNAALGGPKNSRAISDGEGDGEGDATVEVRPRNTNSRAISDGEGDGEGDATVEVRPRNIMNHAALQRARASNKLKGKKQGVSPPL
jgi:hypothetical protein